MDNLVIRHKVRDYTLWRAFYDAEREARQEAGITEKELYRGSDDPDDVVILFSVADKMRAKEYLYSPDLVARRRELLVGDPEVVFLL